MKIIAIVAASENNVIGKGNQMPWHLPLDFKFFKETTSGSPIIMGKNTWYSIGRPLPNRTNIIVSTTMPEEPQGTTITESMEEALALCRYKQAETAFIIGGGALYASTQDMWDEIFMTRVHTHINEGEVFFPEIDASIWTMTEAKAYAADDRHAYAFTIEHWIRKGK